ncbi:hypothetical protein [Streptomyces sp. Ru73]|uniref:hypothetical protein n=1 Tax=Streptomyces sp. Ru73 TaxID=2080748 RepID=UPI0015E4100F|nr:hypothetical protein [Streptomyces sp. Ru73]
MSSSGAGDTAGADEGAGRRPRLQDLLRQADAEAVAREQRTADAPAAGTDEERTQAHRTQQEPQTQLSQDHDGTAAHRPDAAPGQSAPEAQEPSAPGGTPTEETVTREKRAFAARLGEFRRTAVLVPSLDGDLMTATYGGIRWIYAFSDEAALARFAVAAGWEPPPADGLEFLSVYGARLLDVVIPATGRPTGVALDVADAETGGCVMFPPVLGIVPDEAALDGENGEALAAAAAAEDEAATAATTEADAGASAPDRATGAGDGGTTA